METDFSGQSSVRHQPVMAKRRGGGNSLVVAVVVDQRHAGLLDRAGEQ